MTARSSPAMVKGPWVQTCSGLAYSLIAPEPAMVNFAIDVAGPLARQARFSGHIGSGAYSVAQHSVEGADALLAETGDKRLAALFLLHDAHEAYIGDLCTPVKLALEQFAQVMGGPAAARIARDSLKALAHTHDRAIHAAAGLELPAPAEAEIIKAMDIRMLITEREHLLGPSPAPWGPVFEAAQPLRRTGRLRVMPWPDAADAFMARAQRWLPCFSRPSRRSA